MVDTTKTYAGFTLPQLGVIAVVALGVVTMAGIGPIAEYLGINQQEQTMVDSDNDSGDVDTSTSGSTLELETKFDTLTVGGTTITNSLDDEDHTRIKLDASTDGTNYVIKTEDVDGNVVEIANTTDSSNCTATFSAVYTQSVVGGFDTVDQIKYADTKASSSMLIDSSDEEYSPIESEDNDPLVYVDGSKGSASESWTADSNNKAKNVTFTVEYSGISTMQELDDQTVTVDFDNSEDMSSSELELLKYGF